MKRLALQNTKIIFFISMLAALVFYPGMLNAQEINPKKFGEGATEKSEQFPNNEIGTSIRTTVTDKCGKLRQSEITTDYESRQTGPNFTQIKVFYREVKFTEYDCNERPIFECTKKKENGKEYDYTDATYIYNEWGDKIQTGGVKREKDSEGKVKTKKYDPKEKAYLTVVSVPENSETNLASEIPPGVDCPCSDQNCASTFNIYAGPSVLLADLGADREAFFGGQLVANLNVTRKISIGVNAGIYSKKFGIENLNRSLIMVDGQYMLSNPDDCERKWLPEIHVLLGIISEKYGSSKGNGAIYGTGGGAIYMITKKAGIRGQADILFTKWKGSDELNTDFRGSIGAYVRF